MNFPALDKLLPITTKEELIKFWYAVFAYRKTHRDIERDLAHYAFVVTIEARKSISGYNDQLDAICYEFGALEAPGSPDDTSIDLEEYADQLWRRLEDIVNKINKN